MQVFFREKHTIFAKKSQYLSRSGQSCHLNLFFCRAQADSLLPACFALNPYFCTVRGWRGNFSEFPGNILQKRGGKLPYAQIRSGWRSL